MKKESHDPMILDADDFEIVSAIVGRIAHDFNNLVTPLLAYPGLIKRGLPDGAKERELLDVIEKTAQDMVHITSQLLTLSSLKETGQLVLNVNAVVKDAVLWLKKEVKIENITVETDLSENMPKIKCSAEQIMTALQNLCRNAVEAMEQGGRLLIKTGSVNMDNRTDAHDMPVEAGEYIEVTVTDTGSGIPDAVRDTIFNLFVTTKKAASRRGSGIGLSIVHRIMTEHGGHVDFQSDAGKGATFILRFPACKSDAAVSTPPGSLQGAEDVEKSVSEEFVPPDKKRIMIVDDESAIRKTFKMILSHSIPDCRIDLAGNGAEAVEAFEKGHHALLIMDLHMPVMNGQQAFNEIKKMCENKHWEMPSIVFCTGYAHPDIIKDAVTSNPVHCLLSKPVNNQTLVETVKSRLG